MRKYFSDGSFALGLIASLAQAVACFAVGLSITFSQQNPPSWVDIGVALLCYRAAFGWVLDGGWWKKT